MYTVYSLGTYNLSNKNREIIGTASKIESCTWCIHWEHTTCQIKTEKLQEQPVR